MVKGQRQKSNVGGQTVKDIFQRSKTLTVLDMAVMGVTTPCKKYLVLRVWQVMCEDNS